MADTKVRKSINLTKRDSVIITWCNAVKDSWTGAINCLVKRAIRYYMENGKTTCIGKIHFNEDINLSDGGMILSLYLSDSPDIIEWLEQVQNNNIRVSAIIKEIVRKSIEIVDDSEPEWIPSLIDIQTGWLKVLESQNLVSKKTTDSIQPPTSNNVTPPKDINVSKTSEDTNVYATNVAPKKTTVTQQPYQTPAEKTPTFGTSLGEVKEKKKPPRALALSGSHYKKTRK